MIAHGVGAQGKVTLAKNPEPTPGMSSTKKLKSKTSPNFINQN